MAVRGSTATARGEADGLPRLLREVEAGVAVSVSSPRWRARGDRAGVGMPVEARGRETTGVVGLRGGDSHGMPTGRIAGESRTAHSEMSLYCRR